MGVGQNKMVNKVSTKELESRLAKMDEDTVEAGWFEELRKKRLEILMEPWEEIRREEQEWRQKSSIKWLMEGDRNIFFFHSVASGRRRHNFIEKIIVEGVTKTQSENMREGATDFVEKHYKNVEWKRSKISGLPLQTLTELEMGFFEEEFYPEEVCHAISSYDGNKAPGLDDFNLNFIKENWMVIKEDFMCFMEEFHHNGEIVKELNQTFIALIPKCLKPKGMKDCGPICLVGSLYKILPKVLAN
ncbi:hypothetical protein Ddye_032165 [Dipteronia dyeriana]|uniref:Reverse transcriptase n=1 Tax=Dipteronia dyeriana TaxID=168575 RepID=A0AAD9TKQ2_9ROSI|nr:hypothetical protein Ddye_032165 [Dipteronia dyeriana]